MTVQLTRDQDPPKTGLPDEGTDSKAFPAGTPTIAHDEITQEPVGSGDIIDADYSVPLIVTPSATTVEVGGTLTVNGSGLAANGTGTLDLIAGAPGTDGEPVVSHPVTASATGAIPETTLTVPEGTADGDYHLVLSGGAVTIDTTPITVGGATPTDPTLTVDKTEVDGGGDDAARTITVAGANFLASTAGTVQLFTGSPGTGGEAVGEPTAVTTDAAGAFTAAVLVVPEGQAAGDYHLVGTVGDTTADATAVTVTGGTAGPSIAADKPTVDTTGDDAARTVTVTGTGFPAELAGRVFAATGAPGSGGTELPGAVDVTTDATGAFAAVALVIPADTAAGDHHIVATVDTATSDDTALAVTGGAVEATLVADKAEVDSSGDEAARTITVDGAGFPAAGTGTVALFTGAPGSGGEAVEGATVDVTADATGAFTAAAVIVPATQAAGDYHLIGTVGETVADATPITVTGAVAEPTVIPGTTTVAAGADLVAAGTGFPADTAGHVGLYSGATEVGTGADMTTDAAGEFGGATLTVPAETAAGEYQLRGTVGDATSADVAITVTAAPAPTPLAVPANVAAGTPTATEIPLTWDATPNATAYRIESSTDGTTWTPDAIEPTDPTGSATGLTAATEYQLRVTALGDGTTYTDSDPSAAVTATTAAAEAAKRTAAKKK